MKPAPFQYDRPTDLNAALAILAEDPEARILAGGQSLVPMMNFRIAQPGRLVDINRIVGLDHIREDASHIVIGALARHNDVRHSPVVATSAPLIVAAYDWIAHTAVRNRGTLCGNLCHADPASEMPAIMLVLEADMAVKSAWGSRTVPASGFFTGVYETALVAGEMLVEVRVPKAVPGTGWGFEEVSMRRGDFAWATVAVTVRIKAGRIADARIGVAGLGETASRLADAEAALNGTTPSDALFADVASSAAQALDPPDTATISAEYRRDLVRCLLPRALAAAVARAA